MWGRYVGVIEYLMTSMNAEVFHPSFGFYAVMLSESHSKVLDRLMN